MTPYTVLVVGLCDGRTRFEAAAARFGQPRTGTDAAALARELRPACPQVVGPNRA